MRLKEKLSDDRYTLSELEYGETKLIYLEDKLQKTESLGIPTEKIDLREFWEKHVKDKNYCLPCELLLILDPKVISAENCSTELGLTLELLERVRNFLKEGENEGRQL